MHASEGMRTKGPLSTRTRVRAGLPLRGGRRRIVAPGKCKIAKPISRKQVVQFFQPGLVRLPARPTGWAIAADMRFPILIV